MRHTILCFGLFAGAVAQGVAGPATVTAMRDLSADVPAVRRHAARRLAQLGDPAAVAPLVKALRDGDAGVRAAAARALAQLKAPCSTETLAALMLKDEDPNVRTCAAYALGELRSPGTAAALTKALRDPHPTVRDQAAWALRSMRDPASLEPLVDLLTAPDADGAVAWVLAGFDAQDVAPHVKRLLGHPDAAVRCRALKLLDQLQPGENMALAIAALKDRSPTVRLAAIESLVRTHDDRVEQPVRELAARETDPAVRKAAEAAIRKLSRIESLAAHWSFDDRNTKIARDVTGNGTDGQIEGCVTVAGKVGAALRFEKGAYIELGKPTRLNIGETPFTVVAWVKSDTDKGVVVARGGAFCGYSLYILDGKARFGIHREQAGPAFIARGHSTVVGSWTHLAGVVHKDRIELYVNGKLEATEKTTGYIPGNCGQGMEIGFDVSNSPAEITDNFVGIIDEVMAFDAALMEKDVAKLCRQGAM